MDNPLPLTSSEFREAIGSIPKESGEFLELSAFFNLTRRLATSDFAAVMDSLGGMKEDWQARLLDIWAERDPAGAVKWFQSQDLEQRMKLFPKWALTWARVDAASLQRWLAERPPEERERIKEVKDSLFVRALAEVDPAATLALAQLYPGMIDVPTVLRVWAKRDPLSAATKALEASGSERSTAVNFLMREWGAKDPEGALAWIDALSDSALADTARSGFVQSASRNDPVAALKFIHERFPANQQDSHWRFVASFGSMKDPESVVKAAQTETDPKIRRELLAEAIRFMTSKEAGVRGGLWPPAETEAPTDPDRAAELWLSESNSSKKALPYVDEIATALAKRQGIDAAIAFLDRIPSGLNADVKDVPDWLGQARGWNDVGEAAADMPPGPRRSAWMDKAVAALTKEGNAAAAQSFIDRLPAGDERNSAVRSMAGAYFPGNPQLGVELMLSLPDGPAELQAGLTQWLKREPREARRWIEATDTLSVEAKSQVLDSSDANAGGQSR